MAHKKAVWRTAVMALAFGLALAGCTTLSTNNGVAVPNGLFDKDLREPIASYRMWLPQLGAGMVSTIGGITKISLNQIPDTSLFTTGRNEFIEATKGKEVDIRMVNYLIFIEISAFER